MKLNKLFVSTLGVILVTASTAASAMYVIPSQLDTSRIATANSYIKLLGKADYKNISNLFTKNGYVVSTSQGKKNAKEFFYDFLPMVSKGSAKKSHVFIEFDEKHNPWGNDKKVYSDRITARFTLNLKLKDGNEVKGEYIDEFVFAENSNKLKAVYMFENLNFNGTD